MKLQMRDGTVDYGERRALDGVTFELLPGHITAILGPNAAGKSTLMRALAGLVPLTRGRVEIAGRDLRSLGRREIARQLAYLPQSNELAFPISVERVVAMGRYAHLPRLRGEGAADRRAVDEALERVSASELRSRRVDELSGGERQRVLLARTLATGAPLLLLDEPTASLDIHHALDLLELLSAEAERGRSIAVALHDLNLALRFCEHFALLRGGRLLACGGAEEILRPEHLGEAFAVETQLTRIAGVPQAFFSRKEGPAD